MNTMLVVDDNEDIRELMCATLHRAGYHVAEAENGQVALDVMEEMDEPPCLVLLDLMMPVVSGGELLAKLHDSGRLAGLPVVIASAIADRSRPAGARAYLRKPVSAERLLEVVRELCPAAQ